MNKAPPRLQRMLLKLTKYDLDVRYVPGKKQFISDCLSRAPISDTEPVSDPEEMIGINLIDTLCVDSSTLQKFREGHTASPTLPKLSMKPDERQHGLTMMTTAAGRAIKKPQRLLEHY